MAKQLPTRDSGPRVPAPEAESAHGEPGDIPLSRRGFVSAATWSLVTGALLGACGGSESTSPGDPPGGGNPPSGNSTFSSTGRRIHDEVTAVVPGLSFRPTPGTVSKANYRRHWTRDLLEHPAAMMGGYPVGFATYF